MPDPKQTFVANESVVNAELDNEMVLLNVETGIYFGLDELGARIWSMLSSGCNRCDIVERLFTEYDVSNAQLTTDVSEFLNSLVANNLICSSFEHDS